MYFCEFAAFAYNGSFSDGGGWGCRYRRVLPGKGNYSERNKSSFFVG